MSPLLQQVVPPEGTPLGVVLDIGAQLKMQQSDGNALLTTGIAMDEVAAKIDVNHPLETKILTFDFEMMRVDAIQSQKIDNAFI